MNFLGENMSSEAKEIDADDLETEIEIEEAPYVEYDISVNPSDHNLELLSKKISQDEIIIPEYQRRFVWKIEQASKLIESFLMGLPVPQVFLYVNEEDQLEVIDGQQRLMSVHYYMTGFFGEEDSRGNRKVFKLKGLSERSEFNGKTFDELPTKFQRKLKNATLRAIHIKQLRPSGEGDAVFHIFERLNTGGTLLRPQEIRNAVYRGPIVDELQRLNSSDAWQKALGLKNPDKNQKDVELVLRLFSLFETWANYEKPMLRYLNTSMKNNREFSSERAAKFSEQFLKASELVNAHIKNPFRPRSVVNSAVVEAVMIALMEDDISPTELKANYGALLVDDDFKNTIFGSTTDQAVLTSRIMLAKRILKNGASDNQT